MDGWIGGWLVGSLVARIVVYECISLFMTCPADYSAADMEAVSEMHPSSW